MTETSNSFNSKKTLTVGNKAYTIYSLADAEQNGLEGISKLPHSLKVVLENLLRFEDDRTFMKSPTLRMNSVAMVGAMPGRVTLTIFCQRLAPSISAAS